MGVDVNGVAGFTVSLSKRLMSDLVTSRDCQDFSEVLDEAGIEYVHYGNSYSGEVYTAIILQPNPVNVDNQIKVWLKDINEELGTKLTLSDVKFLEETYWW